MHPILFRIPVPFFENGVPVYSYGFMMMVAFLVGILLASRRAKRENLPPQMVMDLALYMIISGVIGARLAFIITDMETPRELMEYFAIWHGGLTFQGGLFLALLVCIWFLTANRLPAGKLADIFAPSVAIGVAFGRIGCFLNGCCWGKLAPAGYPFGVCFPEGGAAHQQFEMWHNGTLVPALEQAGYHLPALALPNALPLPVHPTQLYTSLALVGVFLVLLAVERLPRLFDGMLMVVFLMLYSVVRFAVEFWRNDTELLLAYGGFVGLRLGQILAIVTFVGAAAAFVYLAARARRHP